MTQFCRVSSRRHIKFGHNVIPAAVREQQVNEALIKLTFNKIKNKGSFEAAGLCLATQRTRIQVSNK